VLNVLSNIVFLSGLIGVLCSVMVYRDTKRPFWDNNITTVKFLMTMTVLGFMMSLAVSFVSAAIQAPSHVSFMMETFGRIFCFSIMALSFAKMVLESNIFWFLKKDDRHFLKKTAILMTRPLKKITCWRFILGFGGGIVLPLFIFSTIFYEINTAFKLAVYAVSSFLLLTAGEFLERYLFFRAVVPLKMPGGKIN